MVHNISAIRYDLDHKLSVEKSLKTGIEQILDETYPEQSSSVDLKIIAAYTKIIFEVMMIGKFTA